MSLEDYSDIEIEIEYLLGQTISEIKINEDKDEVRIETNKGSYLMFHERDCCEKVYLEEVIGDIEDLIGSPLLLAEMVTNKKDRFNKTEDELDDSWTWTFYKLATTKGSVTLRWLGESNGYYSEEVTIIKEKEYIEEEK